MSERLNNKLSEKLVKASEVYAQCTLLRAMINIIPHIGSSLDVVLASRGGINKKRITQLLRDLKEEMGIIKEDLIDRTYIESEEFSDILLKVMEASIKSRDKNKIRLYAKFLKGAILIQDRRQFPLEDYLDTLVELTPVELEVARAIYFRQGKSKPTNENIIYWAHKHGLDHLADDVKSVSEEDLPFILLRIQKTGLIREITGSYLGYFGGIYIITETFRKLMRLINSDNLHTSP